MYEPNYTDYSLRQLHDCLRHIDKDKYPRRLKLLQGELAARKEGGETLNDPGFNEFAALDVPISIGFRAWWCFLWRSAVAGLICWLILMIFNYVNTILHIFPQQAMTMIQLLYGAISAMIIGTLVMMQVLAKRYYGYRIRIIEVVE